MSSQILEDRFELQKPLSHSDFGTVYLACDRRYLHRPNCLVTEIRYHQREMRHRLEREAQIIERLGRHPQVPTVLAYFHTDQYVYIVQDHIIGHPLSQEITPGKSLSESYVTKLLQDVLTALVAIHKQGTIHQNLHPEHLIRQNMDGQIFITEFGTLTKLARSRIDSDGTLTNTVPTGPQPYLAPEQIHTGEASVGPQPVSDLYALGLIAIEALTGQQHQSFAYDPAKGLLWRENLGELSLHLAEFIDRLVRQDWRDRFPDAATALKTLNHHSDRHNIAQDSRLPTVIAAPGMQQQVSYGQTTQLMLRGASPINATAGNQTQLSASPRKKRFSNPLSGKLRFSSQANPTLRKLAIGSVAAVLAIGVGVKAYQWGEYRINRVPETWQPWRSSGGAYSAADPEELTPLLENGNLPVQPAAYDAYWDMYAAAQDEGITMVVLAAYQAEEVTGTAEQDYATGYAIDIGGETEESDQQPSFAETATFQWLKANAKDYGFTPSVPKDPRIGGISDEPWHWRYVGDEASQAIFGKSIEEE